MPASRRKLSRRGLLIISLLLVTGGVLTWRFRRLNDVERRLIGSWDVQLDNEEIFQHFHFGKNRRFIHFTGVKCGTGEIERGRWRVRGDTLILTFEGSRSGGWDSLVQWAKDLATGTRQTSSYVLDFDTQGQIWALGPLDPKVTYLELWRRTPEELDDSAAGHAE